MTLNNLYAKVKVIHFGTQTYSTHAFRYTCVSTLTFSTPANLYLRFSVLAFPSLNNILFCTYIFRILAFSNTCDFSAPFCCRKHGLATSHNVRQTDAL